MRKAKALAIGALLLALPAMAQQTVHTIRVARIVADGISEQNLADLVTTKLISRLVADGVSVVEGESDENTDAVLKVAYVTRGNEREGFRMEGPVHLTTIGGKVIWADEIRSRMFARSASDSFTEAVAAKLAAFLGAQK